MWGVGSLAPGKVRVTQGIVQAGHRSDDTIIDLWSKVPITLMDNPMLKHGVYYGQSVTSTVSNKKAALRFRSGMLFLPITLLWVSPLLTK